MQASDDEIQQERADFEGLDPLEQEVVLGILQFVVIDVIETIWNTVGFQ